MHSTDLGHLQVDPDRCDRRVRAGQFRGNEVILHTGLVPGLAEAAHHDLQLGTEGAHELRNVHSGSAVDLRRVFTCQNIDSHITNASTRLSLPLLWDHGDQEDLRYCPGWWRG